MQHYIANLIKLSRSLDLSVLVRILSEDESYHGTGQCLLKVNIISNRKKVMLTKGVHLSSHLADYVL